YLLLAMAAIIIRDGLVDDAFVVEHVVGLDVLRAELAAVDPAVMAARCGIDVAMIEETARGFASAESAAIFYDLGGEQAPFSTLISYLIRLLLTLSGDIGQVGGDVFMETFLPPVADPEKFAATERALASGIQGIRSLGNAQ